MVFLFSGLTSVFGVTVSVGTQVSGVTSGGVPSLASITNTVVLAVNFGGSDLTRDGITFAGLTASGNPTVTNSGAYTLTLSAPEGTLEVATFGDALFGSFIWASSQNQMQVSVSGLNTNKNYRIYYLAGDTRSANFNMSMSLTASNGSNTATSVGTMTWGADSVNGNAYVYLPVTTTGATSVKALMTKVDPSNGASFSGIIVVDETPTAAISAADPRTNSWLTTYSGKYARIYTSDANKTNGVAVTTWSTGSTVQSSPAYSGVQEVYSSSNWVYLRTSGLGSHTMGPWYLNAAHTTAFPTYPTNQHALYKIPRTPTVPASKTQNKGGSIGYFVDGVTMFNSWDAQYWNGSAEVSSTGNSGYWNRDAYVNEGTTFDPANAHQPGSGQYHYHANPPALRYLLGDHVNFNPTNKAYTESSSAPTKHSPIIGWVADGFPIYGPYGYSVSNNAASGIRRMVSGYVLRNGQSGSQNLTSVGRGALPQWAVRMYGVSSNIVAGPAVSTTYPLGRYMEDNDYLGDLGYTQGTNTFDLDEYNGRWCVTPEFPGGTYAYFTAIAADGTPLFPYNIGFQYYGNPTGASATSISESVVTNFVGGPNAVATLNTPSVQSGAVKLTWSATEGGTYMVQSTTNLSAWITNSTTVTAVQNTGSYTNVTSENYRFYRVARTALATYDSAGSGGYTSGGGGGGTSFAPGGSVTRGTTNTVTITITAPPNLPPANAPITSVTLAGSIVGTSVSYPTSGTVLATFVIPTNAPTGLQNIVVQFAVPTYTVSGLTIN